MKFKSNIFIFAASKLSVLLLTALTCLPMIVKAQNQCSDLFRTQIKSTSTLEHSFLNNDSAILPNNKFRSLFVSNTFGQVNYSESGSNLKTILQTTPESIRWDRAEEIQRLIKYQYSLTQPLMRTVELWIALMALDPTSGLKLYSQHVRSQNQRIEELNSVAQFMKSFDPKLSLQLAKLLLEDYTELEKRFSPSDLWLAPKRSALYLSKLLLDSPMKLKSKTANGKMRFGAFDDYIKNLRKTLGVDDNDPRLATASQVASVVAKLQEHLKIWAQNNPDEARDVSIVLTGSFINGLPTNRSSDIDVLIFNDSYRKFFFSYFNLSSLQKQVDQNLKDNGFQGGRLPLTSVIDAVHRFVPRHFHNLNSVIAHGNLGTLSFHIFADHVDIIVHDEQKPENNFSNVESFRAE